MQNDDHKAHGLKRVNCY